MIDHLNDAATCALPLARAVLRLFLHEILDPDFYPLFQQVNYK